MTATSQQRARRSGLAYALDGAISRLQQDFLAGSPGARADLAKLRTGARRAPGEDIDSWMIVAPVVPEQLAGTTGTPNRFEVAAFHAMTLYAMAQQGNGNPLHVEDHTFAEAFAKLMSTSAKATDSLRGRFAAALTSTGTRELVMHIRPLIQILAKEGIALDFAQLGDDLASYADTAKRSRIRTRWGRSAARTALPVTTDHDQPQEA